MASFIMETIPVRLEFMTNPFFFLTIDIALFIWLCVLYYMNPAGPAAKIHGGGGGVEGQERDGRGRDGFDSVFGEGEENDGVGRGEGNEEDEEDPSAWVVLKGQMVEGLRAGLAQSEVPLDWWRREWKGSLLLLGIVILWSLIFDPDLSEPENELAKAQQTIAVLEMPETASVICKLPTMMPYERS